MGLFGDSGKRQARAMIRAAEIQAEQQELNRKLYKEIYEENKTLMKPWVDYSGWARDTHEKGMKSGTFKDPVFSEKQFAEDFKAGMNPGYEFTKSEVERSQRRLAGVSGYSVGGRAHTQATGRSIGALASQEYNSAYQRALVEYRIGQDNKRNEYNRLAAIAGIGQIGPASQIALSNNYANQIAQANTNEGNALAAGTIGAAQARAAGKQQRFNNIMAVGGLALGGLGVFGGLGWVGSSAGAAGAAGAAGGG